MKKQIIIPVLISVVGTSLVGCGGGATKDETIVKALASLSGKNHYVDVVQDVAVYKPKDPTVVDIYNKYTYTYGYLYDGDERAFYKKESLYFCDLDKETGKPDLKTERNYTYDAEMYFKDEDGTVINETINFNNEIEHTKPAYFNEQTSVYTPLIFDSEFKNPFDYITYRDIEKRPDGTLTLINEKADFLAECYNTIGLNFITENTINLDEQGRIKSIDFVINDLVEENYTRTNTMSVNYHSFDAVLQHKTPFTHSNPELQTALESIKGKTNYTYSKEYTTFNGATLDYIEGYFTEEMAYWRHHAEEGIEHPYEMGDDYDYKAVKTEDDSYLVYNYVFSDPTWRWSVVMLSSSQPYIIEDFTGMGPLFYNINASVFKKIDDKTYELEPELVSRSGGYFDYQMMGTQSYAMLTKTDKCVINLTDDGQIDVINMSFTFENTTYYINYHLDNIGTTVIPSWVG